jgi:hypothetical protein
MTAATVGILQQAHRERNDEDCAVRILPTLPLASNDGAVRSWGRPPCRSDRA